MNDIQALVEEVNNLNIPNWRDYPINHLVLGLFEEKGEIAGVAKKHSRYELGWKGASYDDEKTDEELRHELAGTVIYASLIAGKMGWDLLDLVKEEVKILRERFGWK